MNITFPDMRIARGFLLSIANPEMDKLSYRSSRGNGVVEIDFKIQHRLL